MPFPSPARDYLLKALAATPIVLRKLVSERADGDPVWDRRPDPERFSLREVLAHMADWEPIWLERVTRIAAGGQPLLPSVDEGALVIENRYAELLPSACLRRIEVGRSELVAYLGGIPDEAWDLLGDREFVGTLTLQQQAVMALSHDGYHLRQVVEWLS